MTCILHMQWYAGSPQGTTMVFQDLCERRKMNYELRSYQVTNPWLGLPRPPYIVVPRVTTVIWNA
jgi:hypothetical protein